MKLDWKTNYMLLTSSISDGNRHKKFKSSWFSSYSGFLNLTVSLLIPENNEDRDDQIQISRSNNIYFEPMQIVAMFQKFYEELKCESKKYLPQAKTSHLKGRK